jgi:hypothetical protein
VIRISQREVKILDMHALNELVGKPC